MPLKRRLLYLAPWHPLPQSSGGSLRILNTLEACAESFRVTLVLPPPPEGESEQALVELCESVVHVRPARAPLPVAAWPREVLALRVLAGPRTLARLRPYAEALRRLEGPAHDIVWAGLPWLALAAPDPRRTIVDLVDVDHLKAARRAALLHHGSLGAAVHAIRLWWIEVVSLNRQLARVVSSEDEAQYLRRWGLTNVHTVPNAVPIPEPFERRARTHVPPQPARLAFVGNMAYGPNVDAVVHFSREVMPLLRQRVPGVTFEVFGPSGPSPTLADLPPDILMRGFVADLTGALREVDAYVAPIRLGGGTKLKVLTALACGVPLVTTPVGAEGLGLEHGTHALICDSPASMAEAVVALLQDAHLAARLAAAGRSLVAGRFSWAVVRAATARWLEQVAPGSGDNRSDG